MGIEFSRSYKASDGKCYGTLKEAQEVEIAALFKPVSNAVGLSSEIAAQFIVENSDKVLDILTTTDASRPKARKVNGGSKPRKKTTTTVTAETQPPSYTEAQRLTKCQSAYD